MSVIDKITINNVTKDIKDSAGQAMIAVEEASTTATSAHAIDSLFRLNGKLYKATSAIAIGDTIAGEGNEANCVETNVDDELIKDVQVNGTSILSDGVANVPLATVTSYGVIRVASGLSVSSGALRTNCASSTHIKNGTEQYAPIVPLRQHESTFFGLAKAAGDTTQSASSNEVGTYTDAAKASIQHMLGTDTIIAPNETDPATNSHVAGDLFTLNGKLYQATDAISVGASLVVGTNCAEVSAAGVFPHDVQIDGTSIVSNGVANVPIGSSANYGVYKLSTSNSLSVDSGGGLGVTLAVTSQIKDGITKGRLIAPSNQHESAFYGLAKAAGDSTQALSDNAIGTYTNEAKTAIKSMIGVNVEDVQVEGASIVSNGIAALSKANATTYGLVKTQSGNTGVYAANDGTLYLATATDAQMKSGSGTYPRAITPGVQNKAVFYGLAQAAGDTTMASSSNAVGTYTDSAKASIKSMFGIVDGSTGTVEVTGTTPTITAVENTRYVCGEVATLSFTPPASGISIVRFTSGTTATVLTLPNTVKFPEWFDATTLEADTIYELCVTDGVYGAVMSWAL